MNNKDILIRSVQAADEDGVAALWKRVFPNPPAWNKRRPDFRRYNIGTQLMKNLEHRLRPRGCTKINLQVRANNTAVVKFYEKLGYSVEPHTSMGKLLVDPDEIYDG